MKRFIRFIPIVVTVLIIAFLTLQYTPKNVEMSERFRIAFSTLCQKFGLDSSNAWWNTGSGIRKLGHILEYGMLGLASGFAFFDSHRVVKGVLISLAFCLAISVVDQVVKIHALDKLVIAATPTRDEVERIKEKYSPRTKIRIKKMLDDFGPEDGSIDTVDFVDGIGQIHLRGTSLALIHGAEEAMIVVGASEEQMNAVLEEIRKHEEY